MEKQVYLTNIGKDMMLAALDGKKIIFTNFAVGDGEVYPHDESDIKSMTGLASPVDGLDNIQITEGSESGGYVRLKGSFSSNDIEEDFMWSELGVYACGQGSEDFSCDGAKTTFTLLSTTYTVYFIEQNEGGSISIVPQENYTFDAGTNSVVFSLAPTNGILLKIYFPDMSNRKLFAYGYDYAPKLVSVTGETERTYAIDELVTIEDGADIVIYSSGSYVPESELNEHINDTNNPHEVTANQIHITGADGRATVNEMVPSFTIPSTLQNISSGETFTSLFGKIAAAVNYVATSLVSHINNKNNPHGDSFQQLSGTVPTENGGTGSAGKDVNMEAFWRTLVKNGSNATTNRNLMIGTYIGTGGSAKRKIDVDMNNIMYVMVSSEYGFFIESSNNTDKKKDIYTGIALLGIPCRASNVQATQDYTWRTGYALMIDGPNRCFYVASNSTYHCHLNDANVRYYFIAVKHNKEVGFSS